MFFVDFQISIFIRRFFNAKSAKIFFELIENIFKVRKDVKLIKENKVCLSFRRNLNLAVEIPSE